MPRGAVKTQMFRLRSSGEMSNQDGGAFELLVVAERDEWAILAKKNFRRLSPVQGLHWVSSVSREYRLKTNKSLHTQSSKICIHLLVALVFCSLAAKVDVFIRV